MLAKFEKRWSLERTLFLTYSAKTLAEAAAGHNDAARDLLTRLLAQLPADAPARPEVEQRLAALKGATAK